jgi:6-pyruvoyltetrahydropterin/6-carboxytetrahydropterin synthase
VRFSVNPFLPQDEAGFNPFASQPAGEGLAIFFELSVELTGDVEPATGFVVNVTDIDQCVRQYVVPIFARRIKKYFRQASHIGLPTIAELLRSSWHKLVDKFGTAKLSELSLNLNPFRKVAVDCEDCKMVYFSEKFEFAATHKLWNDNFSRQRNLEVFGKCANPAGHGHNYTVEVTVKILPGEDNFSIGKFERIVDDQLITLLDHKNLNVDVAEFSNPQDASRRTNPTVENIAIFAWNKLTGKFSKAILHCVTVRETDRTCCSYYGQKTEIRAEKDR